MRQVYILELLSIVCFNIKKCHLTKLKKNIQEIYIWYKLLCHLNSGVYVQSCLHRNCRTKLTTVCSRCRTSLSAVNTCLRWKHHSVQRLSDFLWWRCSAKQKSCVMQHPCDTTSCVRHCGKASDVKGSWTTTDRASIICSNGLMTPDWTWNKEARHWIQYTNHWWGVLQGCMEDTVHSISHSIFSTKKLTKGAA